MKKVKLILEYEMGNYDQNEGIPLDPESWEESLYQSDALVSEMKILEVRVEQC